MAQIIPPIVCPLFPPSTTLNVSSPSVSTPYRNRQTSLPMDSSAAPSVEDIQDRLPSICVDYLSHDWSEEDVWASWRSMTRHKHEIANGVRLENASWRTWQKQRNKLKTISPETLNWLKDSDVTWLYGPLHTAHVEPVRPLKVSSTVDRLGIDRPEGAKKPILKHRTLSEMLTIPMPSSPILEGMGMDDDIDGMADGDRPILHQTKSDTNIFRTRNGPTRKKSPPRGPISGKTTPLGDGGGVTPETQIPNGKRHISFNTFVEQCVAVEGPQEAPIEESDDDMLEMRSSTSTSSRSSRPSISRNASSSSAEHLTIVMIAPTMLKTNGNVASPSQPIMIYQPPPEYVSPPIAGAPAPPAFDFPSPTQQKSRWKGDDDDEYDSVGFDYFGGPDLGGGDASKQSQQPVQSHVGSSHPRSPVVGPPPPQPKWRQPANAIVSEPSSTSSSSTTSLNNVTSPPQPTRSILKFRAPGTTPPEPSSPPPSYFNYNPSPATGIGGMRGSTYEYSGPAGSPVASTAPIPVHPSGPASEEPRGRSSSRERGSSQYDRSTSRGTSSGSGTSHSPASSRSPIEPPTRRSQPGATQLDKLEEGVSWEPEPMDVDYVPERSSTQTPHSSPQIPFRPLKDASPASLPHNSTRVPDFPTADPPTSLSSTSPTGVRATTAHVSTNARPTISQPPGSDEDMLVDGDGEVDGDGSSIMGRAANIASTAKDLLGALWYGANEGPGRAAVKRGHRRGASLG